ncbi:MAG: cytochrome bc1 complex diheme cytochrome c subunit [Ferrimicrobium sp.]
MKRSTGKLNRMRVVWTAGVATAGVAIVGFATVVSYPHGAHAQTPVALTTAKPSSPSSLTKLRSSSVVSGSSQAITYALPPKRLIPLGRALFAEDCETCHGPQAQGSSRAPNLQGLGAATVDFWVSTGRMPLADPTEQAAVKPPVLNHSQQLAVSAYVASLAPGGPAIPSVNVGLGDISRGESLFSEDCAACHTITGVGDALANNVYAPTLYPATTTQIAEAVRTGPGNMPRFGPGTLSNQEVADVVRYVKYLQKPNDRGGIGLGGVGPVAEGFVAIVIGLGSLMVAGYWIGGRAQ